VCDGRPLGDIVNAQLVRCVVKQVHDGLGPVRSVTEQSKIAERLLWAAKFALLLAQLVREFDEQFAVPVPLVLWEC